MKLTYVLRATTDAKVIVHLRYNEVHNYLHHFRVKGVMAYNSVNNAMNRWPPAAATRYRYVNKTTS